jgi:hypothetical protein
LQAVTSIEMADKSKPLQPSSVPVNTPAPGVPRLAVLGAVLSAVLWHC